MKIIAVEGADGVGKATSCALVGRWLLERSVPFRSASFPRYETDIGSRIRESLNSHRAKDPVEAHRRALLFALDRYNFCESASDDCIWVVDRWVASNAAYLSSIIALRDASDWVSDLEFVRLGIPAPLLTILIEAPPLEQEVRLLARQRQHEDRALDTLESDARLQLGVAQAYGLLARSSFGGTWATVSNDQTRELLRNRLNQTLQAHEQGVLWNVMP